MEILLIFVTQDNTLPYLLSIKHLQSNILKLKPFFFLSQTSIILNFNKINEKFEDLTDQLKNAFSVYQKQLQS